MKKKILVAFLLIAILITGCQSSGAVEATPTVTPTTGPTLVPTSTPIVPPEPIDIVEYEGYELVWHDEFDGDSINRENWTFDTGGYGFGNGEAQYYTDARPENARVENGLLVIEARFEKYENQYYTSAKLWTRDLFEFQYGRVEARTKVPEGSGLWPAFWMLGADFEFQVDENNVFTNNWPQCGEIDIMEYLGREPKLIMGTVHGPGYAGAGGKTRWNPQDFKIADEFHTYAIEWNYDGITWFFDGDPYYTLNREDVGNREWVFDHEFFMILNLALGGSFGGTIALDTKFPANYYIDYVRVYQEIP